MSYEEKPPSDEAMGSATSAHNCTPQEYKGVLAFRSAYNSLARYIRNVAEPGPAIVLRELSILLCIVLLFCSIYSLTILLNQLIIVPFLLNV